MKIRSKNITVIGSVLALVLFLCGLFHNELLPSYLAIGEIAGGVMTYLWLLFITFAMMAVWMLPIAFITVAVMEWEGGHP